MRDPVARKKDRSRTKLKRSLVFSRRPPSPTISPSIGPGSMMREGAGPGDVCLVYLVYLVSLVDLGG